MTAAELTAELTQPGSPALSRPVRCLQQARADLIDKGAGVLAEGFWGIPLAQLDPLRQAKAQSLSAAFLHHTGHRLVQP
jgi:hypothetical protein